MFDAVMRCKWQQQGAAYAAEIVATTPLLLNWCTRIKPTGFFTQ